MKMSLRALVACSVSSLLPLTCHALEPGFARHLSDLNTFLNKETPADPALVTRGKLEALLKDPAFAKALARRQFIVKAGPDNLAAFVKADASNKKFLEWVLQSTEAMESCLDGVTPVGLNQRAAQDYAISMGSLGIWKRIFDADPESKIGVPLRLAIATGQNPPGTGNRGAGQAAKPADPVDRYLHFKAAFRNNELVPSFEDLSTWEYRQIVSSNASDEDLAWARKMLGTWRPDLRMREAIIDTTSEVRNGNSSVSYGDSFKNVLTGGGQCGPRSSFAVFISQAFGVPAAGVRQPGHAAATFKSAYPEYEPQAGATWKVVYGRGWGASSLMGLSGPDFLAGAEARSRADSFMQVERLRWLASALNSREAVAVIMSVAGEIGDEVPVIDEVPDSKPDETTVLKSLACPTNIGDFYGSRVRGFIYPPKTGDYVFRIASDDDGDLFLSRDESPSTKRLIAHVRGWTNDLQFDKSRTQTSRPVHLEAGKRYYIEAVQKDNWVNDCLSVDWSSPGAASGVIPGAALSPYPDGAKGTVVREIWRKLLPSKKKTPRKATLVARTELPFKPRPGLIHIEAEAHAEAGTISVHPCLEGGRQVYLNKSTKNILKYTFAVPESGTYVLTWRTAAVNDSQVLNISVGARGVWHKKDIHVPNTHGLWGDTPGVGVELAKGDATLWMSTPPQRGIAVRWLEFKRKESN
jgi:hypothetical protein